MKKEKYSKIQSKFKKIYTYEATSIYKEMTYVVFSELPLCQHRIQKKFFSPHPSSV